MKHALHPLVGKSKVNQVVFWSTTLKPTTIVMNTSMAAIDDKYRAFFHKILEETHQCHYLE